MCFYTVADLTRLAIPSPSTSASLHRDRQRLPLPDEDDEAFAARQAGVDQVPLQHRVVLGGQRNDHGRILRALALVDRYRVGKNQLVEFAKAVGDFTAVEIDDEFAFFQVNA